MPEEKRILGEEYRDTIVLPKLVLYLIVTIDGNDAKFVIIHHTLIHPRFK